ncbi:unnamed protein product, partial [Rotaria sp. Silwood1]
MDRAFHYYCSIYFIVDQQLETGLWTCLAEFWTADNLVNRLAIGEEAYHPPLNCDTGEIEELVDPGHHHHIFVDFVDKYFLDEVREVLMVFLGGESY